MSLFLALISAGLSLFVWIYLLTYNAARSESDHMMGSLRSAFFRGALIALALIAASRISHVSLFVGRDWIMLPFLFYILALPWIWRSWRFYAVTPLIFGIVLVFIVIQGVSISPVWWSPFHEEIGKWFQMLAYTTPMFVAPYIALGFGFIENVAYFTHDGSWSQVIGRTLFSLPIHLFAGYLAAWCIVRIRSRWIGVSLGILGAIILHTLYNWSLSISLLGAIGIIIIGYMWYGWSLSDASDIDPKMK